VNSRDLIFFESGEPGTYQLYNQTAAPCVYLDIRTSVGYDVCEYPDSNKIYLTPSGEIFNKDTEVKYFDGEDKVREIWE
jgi:uncharacterized cupin superfamily protein